MANVFAGGTVVAGAESVQLPGIRISIRYWAHAIHIVEEFAEQASPGLRLGELVVRDQTEAAHIALRVQHQCVVTGAIVGREDVGSRIRKSAIAMVPLLMRIVGANQPVFIKRVLDSSRDMDGVRRLIVGIDEGRGRGGISVQRPKCSGPPVLREIVVIEAKAGANHGLLTVARRVGDSESRRNLLAVIMRNRLRISQ